MAEGAHRTNRGFHPLFTLGHSNLSSGQFIACLKGAGVEVVADVRSRPHSERFPHFSRAVLEKTLRQEGIGYLFLGEELGGRPDDADAYRENGVVDYAARRKSYAFQSGIDRVLKELEARALALLCAEEDPLDCHRFLMIAPALLTAGVSPVHIRRDGRLESQREAEDRLLSEHGFSSTLGNTLFPEVRGQALEKAYELQATKCAFRVDPMTFPRW